MPGPDQFRLQLENYKSIDKLELSGVGPFAIFAGPNGSGKSNLFDGLNLIGKLVQTGVQEAIRAHGGYENIHCLRRKKQKARTMRFSLECTGLEGVGPKGPILTSYLLQINGLASRTSLTELVQRDGQPAGRRHNGGSIKLDQREIPGFAANLSLLTLMREHPMAKLLEGIRLYRIDPVGAKEPSSYDQDASALHAQGHNLALVFLRLKRNREIYEEILDWLQLIVPGMELVGATRQKLDRRTVLTFKEAGHRKHLPAHLISDGTIYLLNLLVALLDRRNPQGIILIEEPERGLHPKAIQELVNLMRERAMVQRPIWVTTHSESLVRAARREELWLVDKINGRTRIQQAPAYDSTGLPMDQAWLSNVFGAGLPW